MYVAIRRILLLIAIFPAIAITGRAQVFVNDEGAREKHFVYEVKQIDEFFERFNNDNDSYIRKVYNVYKVKFKLDRSALIKSLFNYDSQSWDSSMINHFVSSVTLPEKPLKLNFYHDDWFAEANCQFQYNGSTIQIPIILKIVTAENGGAKWVIAAIKPSQLKQEELGTPVVRAKTNEKFINPESHTNNFIELQKVFSDRNNLADYLDSNFFNRRNSTAFYNAVMKSRILFVTVRDVKYHYLQIDNWIFTVFYFSRESLNSGWLINSLRLASDDDKLQYRKSLLEE